MKDKIKLRAYNRAWYAKNPKARAKKNAQSIAWRKTNPERDKVNRQRFNEKLRLACLVYYGGQPPKCGCCGETTFQFLTIDHINGITEAEIKAGRKYRHRRHLYAWLRQNKFPKGFQVLCYNCNISKGHYGKCPHQKKQLENIIPFVQVQNA